VKLPGNVAQHLHGKNRPASEDNEDESEERQK